MACAASGSSPYIMSVTKGICTKALQTMAAATSWTPGMPVRKPVFEAKVCPDFSLWQKVIKYGVQPWLQAIGRLDEPNKQMNRRTTAELLHWIFSSSEGQQLQLKRNDEITAHLWGRHERQHPQRVGRPAGQADR